MSRKNRRSRRPVSLMLETLEDRLAPSVARGVLTLPAGGTTQFTALEPTTWRVVAPAGVDGGSVDATGFYHAPTQAPATGAVLVQATTNATGANTAATVFISSTTANGAFAPMATTKILGQTLVADVDRDGVPDLLDIQGNVNFLKGRADGTFADPALALAGPIGRDSNCLGDLNGDGILDLVGVDSFLVRRDDGTFLPNVNIAMGQGDGTFVPFSARISGLHPRQVAIADLNGDDKNDLAVLDEGSGGATPGTVQVFFNNGTGVFSSATLVSTGGPSPTMMRTGDLNADGRMDLIVGNRGDASIAVMLNLGGTFAPARLTSMGFIPTNLFQSIDQLDLGDLNGDLFSDLVVHHFQGTQSFLGVGDGTFSAAVSTLPAGNFALGHADADGKLDLVLTTSTGAAFYRGAGNGSFTHVAPVFVGNPAATFEFTEINRDGSYDLAARIFDGERSALATFSGGPAATAPLSVEVRPDGATVNAALTLELHNVVRGTLDSRVNWFVNGVAGGDANVGTISIVDRYTALYTAPEPIGAITSVTIEARSALNAAVKDTISVDLTNYHWVRLSNGLNNLDIRSIAYAADASRVYAATSSGVFRSDDNGIRWVSASGGLGHSLPGVAILSVTVDPANPNVVFAGTRGGGIYKSTDGGANWNAVNILANNPFTTLASAVVVGLKVSPQNSQRIIAEVASVFNSSFGVREGSYRSTDGGATWLRLGGPNGTETDLRGVALDTTQANVLYGLQVGIPVRSTDFGDTFTPFTTALTGLSVREIQVNPFNGNHLIVEGNFIRPSEQGTVNMGTTLMETRDGGISWHSVSTGLPLANDYAIQFSPTTAEMVFVGTDIHAGPFLSTAAGELRFHDVSTGLKAGETNLLVKALAIRSRRTGEAAGSEQLFVGTESGVYGSTTTFLSVPQLHPAPANATVAAGGTITFTSGEPTIWRLEAQPGVDVGLINAAGVYTAPTRVPPAGFATVIGESPTTGARGTATIAVTSTTADGTFVPVTTMPASGRVQLVDVDNDGIADMIDAPLSINGVQVRRGLGDGAFGPAIHSGAAPPGRSLFVLGDLNSDGLLDLVGIDSFQFPGQSLPNVHISIGIGGGKFAPFTDRFVGLLPRDVLLVDVNGDGVKDLLVLDEGVSGINSAGLNVLLNDGHGNLGAPILYRTGGSQPMIMTSGDVNNDGLTDIVVGNHGDGSIATLLNRGGTFAPALVSHVGLGVANFPRFNQLELADLNEDGVLDLVANTNAFQLVTLRGAVSGQFSPLGSQASANLSSFNIGHFNSDTHADLLIAATNGVELWTGNGAGALTFVRRIIDGPSAGLIFATEMNRDGNYDVAALTFDAQQTSFATLLGKPVTAQPVSIQVKMDSGSANVQRTISLNVQMFGMLDNAVTWSVNGVIGGNATVGTIQGVDRFTARYRAPDALGSLQSVTIEARSVSRPDVATNVSVALTAYQWSQLAVGLANLDVRDVAYSADGSRLYAATAGGVFRSDDGGAHWLAASGNAANSLPGNAILSVTVDTTNPLVAFAGTRGAGIFKTTDGGTTWSPANTLANNTFTNLGSAVVVRIEVSRFDARIMLAEVASVFNAAFGLREGSYLSTDGGASWLRLGGLAGTETNVNRVTFDPTSQAALYGALANGHLARSTNLGATFTEVGTLTDFAIIDINVNPFNGNHIIVAGFPTTILPNGGTLSEAATLLETRDAGATWHSAAAGLGRGNSFVIEFSPITAGTMLAATDLSEGYYLSTSPVETRWHDISTGLQAGLSNLRVTGVTFAPPGAAAPGTFYIATPNGVYTTAPPNIVVVPRVNITPAIHTMAAGQSATFFADEPVVWSVLAPPGVDAGTIGADGIYVAPKRVPPGGYVMIQAVAPATGARSVVTVTISSATADGNFTQAATSANTRRLLGDVNADGIVDMLEISGGVIQFRRGLGDGTFAAGVTASFANSDEFVLGDINGDRLPDLISRVSFPFSGQPNLMVALGNGAGGFTPFSSKTVGLLLRDLVIADINGDQSNDLVLADEGQSGLAASGIYVLFNDGQGNFGSPIRYSSGGTQPTKVRAGDLNGDGRLDLVVGNHGDGGSIATLINQGGIFAAPVVRHLNSANANFPRFGGFELADLNEDHRLDLLTGTNEHVLLTFLGQGDGQFNPLAAIPTINPSVRQFAIGHFDGDTHIDLLLPRVSDDGIDLYHGNGDGTGALTFSRTILAGFSPSTLTVTELNGDGNYDLAGTFFNGSSFAFYSFLGTPLTANHAPVAFDGPNTTTNEDTPARIVPLITDEDGDFALITTASASHGTVSFHTEIIPGTATRFNVLDYSPSPNYFGPDTVSYSVRDGRGGTDTANHAVNVLSVNDQPIARDDTATTNEDTPVTIAVSANDTDIDGPAAISVTGNVGLSFDVVSADGPVLIGRAVLNADNTITFTPNQNLNGTVSFLYQITDGGLIAHARVTVTINAVNDPPLTPNFTTTTFEDFSEFALNHQLFTDREGDPVSIVSFGQPSHGSTTQVGADVLYTPSPNFNGVDSFSYTLTDNHGATASGIATVTVTPQNDASTAVTDIASLNEDTSILISVLANDFDVDGDAIFVVSASSALHGSAQRVNNQVRYTPDANFFGTDTFTYQVLDTFAASSTGTVNVTVVNVNDAPTLVSDAAIASEDTPLNIAVLANDSDVDNDALTVSAVTPGAKGLVSINANGTVRYSPNFNLNGSDTFTYTARDPSGATTTATVSVQLTPINDAPVAANDSYATDEDVPLTISFANRVIANDFDVDNFFSVTGNSNPLHGSISLGSDGSGTYTPIANFNGADSFTYTITDLNGLTAQATVSLTVRAVNDVPVANTDFATTLEDVAVNIAVLANDSDVEDSSLTLASVTQGARGIVTINTNGTVRYAPNANFNGADTFTYTVSDSQGGQTTGSVSITITRVNDAPIAVNDAATTSEDIMITLQTLRDNDFDDGDTPGGQLVFPIHALNVTGVTQGAHGSVVIVNDSNGAPKFVRYAPVSNYNGPDTFTYTISDTEGLSATAQVTMTVTAVNDTPLFDAISNRSVTEDTAAQSFSITGVVPGPVSATDEASQIVTFTAVSSNPAVIPHPTISGTGATRMLTFQPAANAAGFATISITASDGQSANSTFTRNIAVTVTGVNDAPMFDPIGEVSIFEDGSIFQPAIAPPQNITLTNVLPGPANATDEAGQIVTFTATSSNPALIANPTFSGTGATRTLTYQPTVNASGSAVITVVASDGQSINNSISRSFTIFVTAVNDPPSFDTIANRVISEDSGTQTITLNNVAAGPANEAAQILTFTATSSNTAIIPHPTITGAGTTRTLTYQPAANANGVVTITVIASDGQSLNASFVRTFTITVNPVNDADMLVVMGQSVNPEGRLRNHAYTIIATNAGPDTAANVLVSATVPPGTSYVSSSVTPLSIVGNLVTWSVGSIPAGGQAALTMVVFVSSAAPSGTASTAQIGSAAQDVNPGNNSFTLATSIVSVGTFELSAPSTVVERTPTTLSLAWTVPGGRWRELKTVDLRLRDDRGVIMLVRFDEAANTLSLFNPHSKKFGPPGTPGSAQVLANEYVQIDLATSSVKAAGPTAPTVTFNLSGTFTHLAAGRIYTVEVAATDDLGNRQGFSRAGVLRVLHDHPITAPIAVASRVNRFHAWLKPILARVMPSDVWKLAAKLASRGKSNSTFAKIWDGV